MEFSAINYIKRFFTNFFSSKKSFLVLLLFVFLYTFASISQVVISGSYSDERKIIFAVMDGVLALVFQVFFYNYYFSKLNNVEFSFRKSLWDFPKFLSSCFQLFLIAVFGCVVLFFGGSLISKELSLFFAIVYLVLFIAIFCYVPMIDILFDHYKMNLSPYQKIRSMIQIRPGFYLLCLFFVLLLGSLELISDEILLSMRFGSIVNIIVIVFQGLLSIICSSFVINFFFETSKFKTSSND